MRSKFKLTIWLIALGLLFAGVANAVPTQNNPPPAGFTITGFIQEATLDPTVGGLAGGAPPVPQLSGGTITVNGIKIFVPNNLIVQMPAAAFTWQQMFNPAISHSVGYSPARPNHRAGQTGLALADNPLQGTRAGVAGASGPFPSFEATVQGNIKFDPATGNQTYIAGLILPASQQSLNLMSGVINYIDYTTGRFRVGGIVGNPLSGTLCEINDPVPGGRFGLQHSPDPRFSADTNNPTITTATGYPVGIPRVAPPAVDPLCPITNRPLNGLFTPTIPPSIPAGTFTYPDPFLNLGAPLRNFFMPASASPGSTVPDPWQQVPLMVGDFIDFAGTTFKINPLGPNTAANMFVSVHTLTADLGIYTQPGTLPVYVNCDTFVFGTDGSADNPNPNVGGTPPVSIASEFATRVQIVGFCTDAGTISGANGSASVSSFAVNNPAGTENYVFIPNAAKGGQPTRDNPALVDALPLGRYRIQPGKIVFYAANPTITNLNNLLTREYIVVHSNILTNLPVPPANFDDTNPPVAPVFKTGTNTTGPHPTITACNGLPVGWFQLPNFTFVTPEHTTFGVPTLPSNFQDFPCLFTGDNYAGFQLQKLDPWPGPF